MFSKVRLNRIIVSGTLVIASTLYWTCAVAFPVRSTFTGRNRALIAGAKKDGRGCSNVIVMRDHSAATRFQVGDQVKVVEDVEKARVNLNGRQGVVQETWEKCDVDPTCCCAEQVDPGMAVRVQFKGPLESADATILEPFFEHYFAEEELTVVVDNNLPAFDGLSCTAFKVDKLSQAGQQPRGIFSYDPSNTTDK